MLQFMGVTVHIINHCILVVLDLGFEGLNDCDEFLDLLLKFLYHGLFLEELVLFEEEVFGHCFYLFQQQAVVLAVLLLVVDHLHIMIVFMQHGLSLVIVFHKVQNLFLQLFFN